MKIVVSLILALVFSIITALVLNKKHNDELNKLNQLYLTQTKIIKAQSTQKIKTIQQKSKLKEDKTLSSMEKLQQNIQKEARKLQKSEKKVKKLLFNIKQYQKDVVQWFIQERKKDLIFLSRVRLRQPVINSFYLTSKLDGNFLYKEVVFFNMQGNEIYKKSAIEALKMDISKPQNQICKKDNYFDKITNLQEGQIYISNVIDCKNIKFIRIVTPIVRNFKQVGFLTMLIDYNHIRKIKNKIKGSK